MLQRSSTYHEKTKSPAVEKANAFVEARGPETSERRCGGVLGGSVPRSAASVGGRRVRPDGSMRQRQRRSGPRAGLTDGRGHMSAPAPETSWASDAHGD